MSTGFGRVLVALGALPTQVPGQPPENLTAGLLVVVPALLLAGDRPPRRRPAPAPRDGPDAGQAQGLRRRRRECRECQSARGIEKPYRSGPRPGTPYISPAAASDARACPGSAAPRRRRAPAVVAGSRLPTSSNRREGHPPGAPDHSGRRPSRRPRLEGREWRARRLRRMRDAESGAGSRGAKTDAPTTADRPAPLPVPSPASQSVLGPGDPRVPSAAAAGRAPGAGHRRRRPRASTPRCSSAATG